MFQQKSHIFSNVRYQSKLRGPVHVALMISDGFTTATLVLFLSRICYLWDNV
jgi:hypothetical protein